MINVGIIGATGYTGSELVRLLNFHPEVNIKVITSETHKGQKFSDIHNQFRYIVDIELTSADDIDVKELDVVFLALPHGVSMEFVKKFIDKDLKIIDLSGDFRLAGKSVYEEWYGKEHIFEEGFDKAVYGIPELFREEIKKTNLVANPGCFPTGAIMSVAPLLKAGIVDVNRIIFDSKSGVTGAGVKPKVTTHYSNVNDNFKPYGIKFHRHSIEIQEQLSKLGGSNVTIQFTPHLLPVDRGILTASYLIPTADIDENKLKDIYYDFYKDEPFIRVIDEAPEIKNVRATNFIDVYATYDKRTNTILAFSAIDNLVKGASGAAIQNMNVMFGLDEKMGLFHVPVRP